MPQRGLNLLQHWRHRPRVSTHASIPQLVVLPLQPPALQPQVPQEAIVPAATVEVVLAIAITLIARLLLLLLLVWAADLLPPRHPLLQHQQQQLHYFYLRRPPRLLTPLQPSSRHFWVAPAPSAPANYRFNQPPRLPLTAIAAALFHFKMQQPLEYCCFPTIIKTSGPVQLINLLLNSLTPLLRFSCCL